MNPIFKKLNYKTPAAIHILNAPASFHPAMEEMRPLAPVHTSLAKTMTRSFAITAAGKEKAKRS